MANDHYSIHNKDDKQSLSANEKIDSALSRLAQLLGQMLARQWVEKKCRAKR